VTEELEVLGIVTERLETAGIRYMLTGSMAANYYSVPRMTRDIDLVVELSAGDAGRVCALFEDDFYVDPNAVREAIARRGTFNLIHTALVLKVDCVVRKDTEYHREEFRRRRRVEIGERQAFLVAPEDLIISKLDWARESRSEVQLADVRNLVRSAELDRAYLGRWLPRLGLDALTARSVVTDTSPAIEERYRRMLLERSGAERMRMGASMFATARELAVASIRANELSASAAALRRALFLRFYGGDFGPEARERIVARLDADPRGASRRVAVSWDDLEMP
jgi:hypothetical protein